MIRVLAVLKAAAVIGGYFGIRVIAGYRVDKRKQAALRTHLVDPILLETTFAPREGDDSNLLAEVRDTLAHLNRQSYADEFWNVSSQITALNKKLPKPARATLRRISVRLLETDDRWLRIVGAKTAAGLRVDEAAPLLRALIEALGDAPTDPIDARMRTVMLESLEGIGAGTPAA